MTEQNFIGKAPDYMKKLLIKPCGLTVEGRIVYCGLFKFQDTFGLPLLLVWKCIKDHDGIVAWDEYYKEALSHGWKKEKILAGIREVAHFGYDQEEGKLLLARIESLKCLTI